MTDDEELYDVAAPVDVKFDVDEDQLDKVFEAERLLGEAGVQFDTGAPIDGSPRVKRVWHLDCIGGKGYRVEPKPGPDHMDDEELALWLHNTYEEIAAEVGWETQVDDASSLDELPEKNREVMVRLAKRILESSIVDY